jgi:hypothetical protein
MAEKRRVSFEGRLTQSQYDQRVIDGEVDVSTVYFIRDTKRIYVGHECFNVSSSAFGGIPIEYVTDLPDGTLEKRAFSEDGDEWRLTFLQKGIDDDDFKVRHTFEFAIETSEDGTELGVIRIDNKNVGFSNAHAVYCEDVDQIVDGVKTFIGDLRVPDEPRTDQSAVNKKHLTEELDDLHQTTRSELSEESLLLQRRITAEAATRLEEDEKLGERIDTEARIRGEADQALSERITYEADRLDTRINQEAIRRENEDEAIRADLATETARAIARENQIEEALGEEIERATTEEADIRSDLAQAVSDLRDEDAQLDSTAVHKAGEETITGQKTFTQPVLGSIESLTIPRDVITDLSSNDLDEFDGTRAIEPGVKGVLNVLNGGTGRPYGALRPHLIVKQAEEYQEVIFPGTPAEEIFNYISIEFNVPDISHDTGAIITGFKILGIKDTLPRGGLKFQKVDGTKILYRKVQERNQALIQRTLIDLELDVEFNNKSYKDYVSASVVPLWGSRQDWLLGDWGYRLDSQDSTREFYDVDQISELLMNVEDLGVVDSAYDPEIRYRYVVNIKSILDPGVGYEKGDLLVLKIDGSEEWADFNHARAYVEGVDAAGGITAISLQYGGLFSPDIEFNQMVAFTNTSRSDAQLGSYAKLEVVVNEKKGKTLAQLTQDPDLILKEGMTVNVIRDETLEPISSQKYKYFDENRDGKPEWHPWMPYKRSRDYQDDGEFTSIDNSETKEGRLVTLTTNAKKRITSSAQVDEDETITGDWTIDGDWVHRGALTIQPPVVNTNPTTKKYVDDLVKAEEDRALAAEGDRSFDFIEGTPSLTDAIQEENDRAETAEAILAERATHLEEKSVQITMAGDVTDLESLSEDLVSETYLEETKIDVLRKSALHTTPSILIEPDGIDVVAGRTASLRISSYDPSGKKAFTERQPDGSDITVGWSFTENPTLEVIKPGDYPADTTGASIGARVRARSIREEHLMPSVYNWINRKLELSNLTRVRDDDLVFMETDAQGHRVETNQRPFELDSIGDYGLKGEDPRVDWLNRSDLVLRRLDQTIQGVKEFVGLEYDENSGGKYFGSPYYNGDYNLSGENAIQIPEKTTDVFTSAKDKGGGRYGEKRNAATEYQVYRLLFDSFSDDGEDSVLGRVNDVAATDLVAGKYPAGQVIRETHSSILTKRDIGKMRPTTGWDNKATYNIHPETEDPDTNPAAFYETGANFFKTYHDLLKRTTYSESWSVFTDDLGIERIGSDYRLSGLHLLNKDQNKDEPVNGLKTFIGNENTIGASLTGDKLNAIQVPSKKTDVHTTSLTKNTGALFDLERNVATEYQVYRLLYDAFSDDGEDLPLGVAADIGGPGDLQPQQAQVLRKVEQSVKMVSVGVWNNLSSSYAGPAQNILWVDEDPQLSEDQVFESAINFKTTYHDLINRTTYSDSYSWFTTDLMLSKTNRGISITGAHLLNKDQNKNELVNGLKRFTGDSTSPVDSTNAVFVPEKETDTKNIAEVNLGNDFGGFKSSAKTRVATEAQVARVIPDAMSGATYQDTVITHVEVVTGKNTRSGDRTSNDFYAKIKLTTRDIDDRTNSSYTFDVASDDIVPVVKTSPTGLPASLWFSGENLVNRTQNKKENVNGEKTFEDDATFESDVDIDGNLNVDGNTDIGGSLTADGNVILNDALTDKTLINGAAEIKGTATIQGATTINNTLTVGSSDAPKAVNITGPTTITGVTTLNGLTNFKNHVWTKDFIENANTSGTKRGSAKILFGDAFIRAVGESTDLSNVLLHMGGEGVFINAGEHAAQLLNDSPLYSSVYNNEIATIAADGAVRLVSGTQNAYSTTTPPKLEYLRTVEFNYDGHLMPIAYNAAGTAISGAQNLGSSSYPWNNLYLKGYLVTSDGTLVSQADLKYISGIQSKINSIVSSLEAKITALDNKIDDEVTRATGAEAALDTKIASEVTRATGAEAALDTKIANAALTASFLPKAITTATNPDPSTYVAVSIEE